MGNRECPVCGAKKQTELLKRHNFPMTSSKYLDSLEEAVSYPRGEIDMVVCGECGFIYNRLYDAETKIYDDANCNERIESEYFSRYLSEEADYISSLIKDGFRVAEIGCGKNYSFLKLIHERASGAEYIGFDPTVNLTNADGIRLKKEYFVPNRELRIDAVISRHVIEHIPDPAWLMDVRKMINMDNQESFEFIETPDAGWNLDHLAWYNWSYEHCSNFSKSTFMKAAEIYGWGNFELRKQYESEYFWLTIFNHNKKGFSENFDGELERELRKVEKYQEAEIEAFEKIEHLVSKGEWALWGVAGKGTTVLNLFDPEREKFRCVIDVDKNKHGKYVCGSGHRISSPAELLADCGGGNGIENILIMNKLYRDEIRKRLVSLGLREKVNIVAIDEL